MNRLQQGSILRLKRKGGPDVWVFRWYDETNGTRTYRKRVIGSVVRYPHRWDAEKVVESLRTNINSELKSPETVDELITHYRKHELTEEKKAYATVEANTIYLTKHIAPKWGAMLLMNVRTVEVEKWLHTLKLAPGSRSKIRNIMSAMFNHAIRHEWMDRNPISKVRTSAKRLREPDVLSPAEFASILPELELRERAMVMLVGSTGLRRSELVALTWSDIDLELMQGPCSPLLRAESLRRHEDRSEPQTRSAAPGGGEVPGSMEARVALCCRARLHLPVVAEARQTASFAGHPAQEGDPSRDSAGRYQGQEHWVA